MQELLITVLLVLISGAGAFCVGCVYSTRKVTERFVRMIEEKAKEIQESD